MKKKITTKKQSNYNTFLTVSVFIASAVIFIFRLYWGYNNANGSASIIYSKKYPIILFFGYLLVSILILPFIRKTKADAEHKLHIIPLMLFSALGMMKIDSVSQIKSENADYSPAVMFLIFLITLIITAFLGHSIIGAVGIIVGTAFFSAFGICFAPFIVAFAYICENEEKKEHLISLILNSATGILAIIYAVIRLDVIEIEFSKKYIPASLLTLALIIFFTVKKEYKLLPLSCLPLFPLAAGMIFGSFPTPLFTLSASVAPLVILFGTAALTEKNKKIKDYAEFLSHNPIIYIIIAFFVLHTAYAAFTNPGFFRNTYYT